MWCTTFRLNPFHRIDTSSNMTIGLKNRSGMTFRQKKLRILDEMSHLCYFSSFSIFLTLFLQYSDDLPVVRHTDFIWRT